jgi:hypothetical protein
MNITIKNQTLNRIVTELLAHVPSLAFDYEAEAAPLAVAHPHAVPEDADIIVLGRYADGMCPIERAIRARDIAATVAAL